MSGRATATAAVQSLTKSSCRAAAAAYSDEPAAAAAAAAAGGAMGGVWAWQPTERGPFPTPSRRQEPKGAMVARAAWARSGASGSNRSPTPRTWPPPGKKKKNRRRRASRAAERTPAPR